MGPSAQPMAIFFSEPPEAARGVPFEMRQHTIES